MAIVIEVVIFYSQLPLSGVGGEFSLGRFSGFRASKRLGRRLWESQDYALL